VKLIAFCVAGLVFSVSKPIHAENETTPIAPYLDRLNAVAVSTGSTSDAVTQPTITLAHLLPVRSPHLIPGPVTPSPRAMHFYQPLFLIGSDPASLTWLASNQSRLQQIHAVGLLVQAETEADVERVRQAARGLSLIPASGEAVAEALSITHYPVLITREGISP
jgi:integrating conjugative element protein (TIGR03765 family)